MDSVYTHSAWLRIPKNKAGIEGITYPLLSNLDKSIATRYHVLKEDEGVSYRALFLLDKQGIIRHQLVNDLFLGRSMLLSITRPIERFVRQTGNRALKEFKRIKRE